MGVSIRTSRNTRISLPFGAALLVIPIWLAGFAVVIILWLILQFIVAVAKGIAFVITFLGSKRKGQGDHEQKHP